MNFLDYWSNAKVFAAWRIISDPSPIILYVDQVNFGPKPFRIFNSWLDLPDFDLVIRNSWLSGNYRGSPDIILKNKIKKLREDIKVWHSNFMAINNKLRMDLLNTINVWDQKAENANLSDLEALSRESAVAELLKLDQIERENLKQKCRITWAIEGDENSRFFHTQLR